MENEILTKPKRGNPNWAKKAPQTETTKPIDQDKKLEAIPAGNQATSLQAQVIELGIDVQGLMATESIFQIVGNRIAPKYPEKHLAFVNRDDASRDGQGWEYLKMIKGKSDVEVVTDMDKATKTHWNVLCWRDIRIQRYVDAQDNKARERSNNLGKNEAVKEHVKGLNESLKGIHPEVGARPLGAQDL